MQPSKYALVIGYVFVLHLNLGLILAFPANLTQPWIVQISATCKEALWPQCNQYALIKAFKKQPTNTFKIKSLKEIEDTHVAFSNISIQDIPHTPMQHV